MGRSVIVFQERCNGRMVTYMVLWKRLDDYFSGFGQALAIFLKHVLLVDGLQINPEAEHKDNMIVCNGFGDLVARFIAKHKCNQPTDDIILCPAVVARGEDAAIIYYVTHSDEGICVQVVGHKWEPRLCIYNLKMSIDKFVKITLHGVDTVLPMKPPEFKATQAGNYLNASSLTGTDSLIIFQEMLRGETVIYAVIYQQWGGEEDGVGHALATFLKKILYNPKSKENLITTTGFGDLVAQFISMHRVDKSSHPFYILPAIHGQKRKYNYYVTKNKSYATWVQFWYRCYTTDGIQVRMNNSKEMSVAEFVKMCAADTAKTLKKQCTSVIMSALLQQRLLEPDQLYTRLPDYVPTMIKKSITQMLFGSTHHPAVSTTNTSTGDSSSPCAKRIKL